jgi:hypothetical protein
MLDTRLIMPQKTGKKRLYRTLSLIRELRSLGYPYQAYKDTIWLEISTKGANKWYALKIESRIDCYYMHMAKWSMNQVELSYNWELRAVTGIELLINLVQREILPPYFMPITAKPRTTDEA